MTSRRETSASLRAAGHGGDARAEQASVHRVGPIDVADRDVTDDSCVIHETSSGFFVSLEVEMTHARAALQRLGEAATGGWYAGVLTRAAAVALLRQELAQRAWQERVSSAGALAWLQRWRWMLPFGWMQRLILRLAVSRRPVRAVRGALQVFVRPGDDAPACGARGTPARLGLSAVAERQVIRRGQPAVRWMATLTCSGCSRAWNGARIARVLTDVKRILESGDLVDELARGAANDVAG